MHKGYNRFISQRAKSMHGAEDRVGSEEESGESNKSGADEQSSEDEDDTEANHRPEEEEKPEAEHDSEVQAKTSRFCRCSMVDVVRRCFVKRSAKIFTPTYRTRD